MLVHAAMLYIEKKSKSYVIAFDFQYLAFSGPFLCWYEWLW